MEAHLKALEQKLGECVELAQRRRLAKQQLPQRRIPAETGRVPRG